MTRRLFTDRSHGRHNIVQAAILILSAAAIAMVNLGPDDHHWRFWGNVLGIMGSPFWLYASATARPWQWGQFALSMAYAVIWVVGAVRYF